MVVGGWRDLDRGAGISVFSALRSRAGRKRWRAVPHRRQRPATGSIGPTHLAERCLDLGRRRRLAAALAPVAAALDQQIALRSQHSYASRHQSSSEKHRLKECRSTGYSVICGCLGLRQDFLELLFQLRRAIVQPLGAKHRAGGRTFVQPATIRQRRSQRLHDKRTAGIVRRHIVVVLKPIFLCISKLATYKRNP